MINFKHGDIFKAEAQTLVATVNCVGIMGKGLAKEFKLRFPEMFKEYVKACNRGELRKGNLFLYKNLHTNILCFPTKDNWKGPSKYEFIEEGLKTLRKNYKKWGITSSIAIPPLGCGLGGLDWQKVKSLIIKYLEELPINIEVYEPLETGDRVLRKNPFRKIDKVKLTPASVYTGEMIRIARKSFPPEILIGRLLLQKIAFFSQLAGLPIKLKFEKYKLGPFDYKLKFNVDRLEGLYVRDESPNLNRSSLKIIDEAEWLKAIKKLDLNLEDARKRIKKAIDFLKKYSLKDIELFASVCLAWTSIVSGGKTGTEQDLLAFINEWKYKKFSREEIITTLNKLTEEGWLNPSMKMGRKSFSETIKVAVI